MATNPTGERTYLDILTDPPMLVVAGIAFVSMVGFEAVSPALPTVASSLGVSDARVGLVMTAFSVPMILFVPVTGVLADVHGRRAVIIPSLIVYGVAGGAIAGVDTFLAILSLRVLQGVAFAGILSISVAILGDLYTGAEGSTAQGFRTSAAGAAALVLPAIAGYLAGVAWSHPFLLHLLALPVALLAYRYVPETAADSGATAGVVETVRGYGRGIRAEFGDPQLSVLVVGGFVRGFVRIAVLTFVPLFAVRVLGSSLVAAGAILSARGAARLVIPPLAGPIVGRASRRWALLVALGVSTASVAAIPFVTSVLAIGALVALYTAGDSLFSPVLKEAVTSSTTDEHRAGVVNTMYVFQYGGEATSPVVFGTILAVSGFGPLFLVAGVTVAVYAVVITLSLAR